MNSITIKLPTSQVTSAAMTQADIDRLQHEIDWRLGFHREQAVVIVVDEQRRMTVPLYAPWLDEKNAFAFAHLQTFDDAASEVHDLTTPRTATFFQKAEVVKTINEALDVFTFQPSMNDGD